jgi:hypothetical protein
MAPNAGAMPGALPDSGAQTMKPNNAPRNTYFSRVCDLKMLDCLEYQSCESDDWETTQAYRLQQAMRRAAIRALPGYESAQWEFHLPEEKAPAIAPKAQARPNISDVL